MDFESQIAFLQRRLNFAMTARDAWRAIGKQENYLTACSSVEQLARQLDELEKSQDASACADTAHSHRPGVI